MFDRFAETKQFRSKRRYAIASIVLHIIGASGVILLCAWKIDELARPTHALALVTPRIVSVPERPPPRRLCDLPARSEPEEHNVPTTDLRPEQRCHISAIREGQAGKAQIPQPSSKTKEEIRKANQRRVMAVVQLCLDTRGNVTNQSVLKSSGFPEFDRQILGTTRHWQYRPCRVNGEEIAFCTHLTVVYHQE
jgi:TonB family protein